MLPNGGGGGGDLPPITTNLLWQIDASTNDNVYYDYANSSKATNGDTVDRVTSTAGSRFVQQVTAALRPTWNSNGQNGKGYLDFNPGSQGTADEALIMAWETLFDNNRFTSYIISQPDSIQSQDNNAFIFCIGQDVDDGFGLYEYSGDWETAFTNWNYDYVDSSSVDNSAAQLVTVRTGAGTNGLKIQVNDDAEDSTTGSNPIELGSGGNPTQQVTLGCGNQSGSLVRSMDVKIYEWVVYDGIHTDTEKETMKTYFNNKYNLW